MEEQPNSSTYKCVSRKNETSEQKRARLDRDNERRRFKRSIETAEERSARLAKETERRRIRCENAQMQIAAATSNESNEINLSNSASGDEMPHEKRIRLDNDNEQNALANEKDIKNRYRLDCLAQKKRVQRANETAEVRKLRLDRDSKNQRDKREHETIDEAAERNRKNAEQVRVSIESESLEQRGERLQRKNELQRLARQENSVGLQQILLAGQSSSRSRQINPFLSIAQNAETDESKILENYLGKLQLECSQCSSLNFAGEITAGNKIEFTRCCQKGQVKLEPLKPYPEYFKNLLTGKTPESNHFMKFIRCYNSSFAFASMGAKVNPPKGNGPCCFRVCGQITHRSGALHPGKNDVRSFSQIYILDPNEAAYQRLSLPENKDCNELLMRKVAEIMDSNPFTRSVKMLHEVEKEAAAEAAKQGVAPTQVMLAILHDRSKEQRRYNIQAINEVAVVFQSKDGEPPFERDIIMHLRPISDDKKDQTRRINILNPNLDALTYPVLFPNGDKGWHTELQRTKVTRRGTKPNNEADNEIDEREGNAAVKSRKTVSMREFFSYRLSIRRGFNPILSAGRLTHQYIVDAYIRAEANDLNFIRTHQPLLLAETYNNLLDHINSDAVGNDKLGTAIILPSSFPGSPRNMHQHYQDAMAIVTKFGKPDIFLTMTCNPKWKEIVENLEPGQKAEDRPDLVARVFNLKLKELLEDIRSKDRSLFGKIIAMIYVIEFQKRGLPHVHILIILDKDHKLTSIENIDRIVKAEIPDKETSPNLYAIVTKNMIHTPCGKRNPNSPCMVDGKCSKTFPKPFQNTTLGNIDGYPQYKRRAGATAMDARGNLIDNSWVVPYNPFLSLKYNCHINVEICASVKSVKYLFKYVYKGHDCANVEVKESNNEKDESKEYVDSRYVSAPEAIWRLFSFRMHEQSHTICRLPVHLEFEQTICFMEGTEHTAVQNAGLKHTKLTAWFALNQIDQHAREYKFWEIPVHYTWDNKLTKWNTRKRGGDKVIGRMYTVSLKDQERYFLRMLLMHEKGAISFADLRTVYKNNETIVLSTYREAAKEKGYVLDETIWQSTIDDAKTYAMPYQLRQLFAYICALGPASDKLKLWNDNKVDMIEDFCYKLHEKQGECRNCELYALKDLKETLGLLRCSLTQFNLPTSTEIDTLPDLSRQYFNPETDKQKAEEMINSLNPEQKIAFDNIIESTNDTSFRSKCYFLDGPGGSGKTYLYTALLHYFRGKNELCLPSASTGIAANLLIGGRTYHSLFALPIPIFETSNSRLGMKTIDAKNIKLSKLLIVDECTMASSHVLNCIDRLLKSIMQNQVPFGGKTLLLGGDFRQCLTIVPRAMRSAIVQSCIKYSDNWNRFQKISLTSNMRSVDPVYSEWLLKLGSGLLGNEYGLGDDVIEIPSDYLCKESLIKEIFGEEIHIENIDVFTNRAILCPKNVDVDKINEEIINIIDGESRTYISDDQIETEDDAERVNFPIEFLNTLNLSGMPSHKLTLKVGTIVMLLRNLNTKNGLCNGTRLVVRSMLTNVIEAEVLTGSAKGQITLIPRIDLTNSDNEMPFTMRRRQFPLKPSFAMTINKSQGQTLDKVGIHLSEPVFGHGQLYVAFSRVRRGTDVKVKVYDTEEQGKLLKGHDNVFTKNVVYREVFD